MPADAGIFFYHRGVGYWLNHEGTKAGRVTKIKCFIYQWLPAVESSINNPNVQVCDARMPN